MGGALKALRQETKRILTTQATLSKCRGLDPHLPPPPFEHLLKGEPFTVWEWWGGVGKISKFMCKLNLFGKLATAGPVITYDMGWDLRNPKHQQALWTILTVRGCLI